MPQPNYVDVIVPLAFGGILTYSLPKGICSGELRGRRVIVPLGKRKLYTAIVIRVHNSTPEGHTIKEVISFPDETPLVNGRLISLWLWTADYYLCSPGEVLKAAIPSVLLPGSETVIRMGEEIEDNRNIPGSPADLLLEIVRRRKEIRISSLPAAIGGKSSIRVVNDLLELGALSSGEVVRAKKRGGDITIISLTEKCRGMSPEEIPALTGRSPRQREALEYLVNYFGRVSSQEEHQWLPLEELTKEKGINRAVLSSLKMKELISISTIPAQKLISPGKQSSRPLLTSIQQESMTQLMSQMKENKVALLHGVTSSGKTELYFELIETELEAGRQVLYMVPEIALTEQLTERITRRFGDIFKTYHSRLNEGEKLAVWRSMGGSEGKRPDLIVGVRSSLFLPFEDLGLIIVDEEHDHSYKQYDPAPRYNARDLAVIAAQKHNGKVLLGSATPSVETYYNAATGKYGFASLLGRYGDVQLPVILLADTRKAMLKKKMISHFTPELIQAIEETLSAGEQVMLLRNRRGFAAWVECRSCGYIPECRSCSVKLTYHRLRKTVVCHYCGYYESLPGSCSNCNSTDLTTKGYGTEKIEDELKLLFPDAVIERMDRDTTSGKDGFSGILKRFASGRTDILVGTQMIAKGHDFSGLTLIGVLNADATLNYPDFRSYERCFQLLEQVSGRAGRREKRGRVIIQTTDTENELLQTVKMHDYELMYRTQIAERKVFRYPPFTRIVKIGIRHRDRAVAERASAAAASLLGNFFGARVLGPEYDPVERVRNYFARSLIIKLEKERSLSKAREYIREVSEKIASDDRFRGVRVVIDVDPQ